MKIFSNLWKKLNKEIIAGLTTFFTMSYIVIVNPLIWSTPGSGVSLSLALTATVLILVIINLIAGLVIKLPYAFGPGMGLNVFVVYTVILSQKIPFPIALGVIFWSSFLFILISVLPVRKKIIEALPENMKHAMSCGIGLFLAFIGFKNLNLITSNPSTLLQIGSLDVKVLFGFVGFCIAFYFFIKNKPYAFLISILAVTGLSIVSGQSPLPDKWVSIPDLHSVFTQIDIWGAFKLSLVPTILSLLMTNLFDSISTIIALSHTSGLRDKNGNPLRLKQILLVDSFGSLLSSFLGTSPTAVYIESAAGIQAGGRTGIVPIVVALCFLPCLFFEPIIHVVPAYATAPILVFVGILMTLHLKNIKVKNFDDIIPIFLTIILMPLTSSVTYGVIFGIVSYVVIKLIAGKYKEISLTLWMIGIVSLFVFLTSFTKQQFDSLLKTAQTNAQKNSVLSADFKQEFYSALREKTTVSSGKLFLKGDLFRWEIEVPRKQLYINDGKYVWKYEPEFNHVEKFNINSSDLNFIKLLNHLNNLQKFYRVSQGEQGNNAEHDTSEPLDTAVKPRYDTPQGSNSKVIDLLNINLEPLDTAVKPRYDTPQRTINVSIQIKTGYVKELVMNDPNGNNTKLTFDHFSTDPISKEKFVFIPPKGAIINTFKN